MHDLIGSYERINRVYRQYIESAFPLRFESLSEERRYVLSEQGLLSQPPVLETVPIYPTFRQGNRDLDFHDVCQILPTEYQGLTELGRYMFPPDARIFRHQWESIDAVINQGKDIVVTTGTGSGKTECFLLPILAEIAKDSLNWPDSPQTPPQAERYWWNHSADRGGQWSHTQRNHAVKAMILYPLNALVEDQLRRLRQTVDHENTHRWLDRERSRNRILFGRYTGQTAVSGNPNSINAVNKLRLHLQESEREWRSVLEAFRRGDIREEILYYFANIDGGEMWSRWDMQATPPDILITNYSMLNIMLMRSIEETIFTQTREWLENDESNTFFLVIDELHAYRGTPGTEVAYIIRLLLKRLGLDTRPDQLRILTTSASVQPDDRSMRFLREFFGRDPDRFQIITGQQEEPQRGTYTRVRAYQDHFARFANQVQSSIFDPMSPPDIPTSNEMMNELSTNLGRPRNQGEDPRLALAEALKQIEAPEALRDACATHHSGSNGNRIVRPTQLPTVDSLIFNENNARRSIDDSCASDAMRGLLLATSMSFDQQRNASPQPTRGHLFFHNLQNLWVCSNPNCNGSNLQIREQFGEAPPVGVLHAHHQLACSACGGRVLDLIVCEVCGDIMFGGFREINANPQIMTADQPDIERMPDQVVSGRCYEYYSLFWPYSEEPEDSSYNLQGLTRQWVRAKFNYYTGQLRSDNRPVQNNETFGWVYRIQH